MEIKRILPIFLFSLFFIFGNSCSDDQNINFSEDEKIKELPVDFSIIYPEEAFLTRSINNPKTKFIPGDVIHITGTFTLSNGTTEKRYGALTLDQNTNNWIPVLDSGLTWPNTAVSGVFEAYYIAGLTGILTTTNFPLTYLLSDVTPNSDPLYAKSPVDAATGQQIQIAYGNAVNFQFQHILTYLTLDDMYPIVSTQFYFTTNENILPSIDSPAGAAHTFNNAFSIQLNSDNTISLDFIPQVYENEVYVSAQTVTSSGTDTGSVSFFLQPGYYETFQLKYPSSTNETAYTYLTFTYVELPGVENTPPQLNAGYAYDLDIQQSPGVTIEKPSENPTPDWDDNGDYWEVDVDAFLTAINNGSEYVEKNETIIESTAQGLVLKKNVDFKNFSYILLNNGKQPDVPTGIIFDGNYHYIKNLAGPLFYYNFGTIKNLGINTVQANNVVLDEYSLVNGTTLDQSRKGIICNWNQSTIENIRISDVTMSATVKTDRSDDVQNIGCLLGSNTGSITQVRLSGNFNLSVANNSTDGDGVNCTMNIGALIGQNASGSVFDISALEGQTFSVSIINSCTGANPESLGAFYVGGAVGYNESYINSISLPLVSIDCSQSRGTKSFIGLLTGETTTSSGTQAQVLNSSAAGTIKGGEIYVHDDLDSGSYIGGISGAIVPVYGSRGIFIFNCVVAANNLDNSMATAQNAINSTGGCIGRIYDGSFTIDNIILSLAKIIYPDAGGMLNLFYGSFAGFAEDKTWDKDYAGNNIDIVVNTSGINDEIGGNTLN